ncbi:DUF6862 domain-containing protein [Conservatibacter flavescens]|uniref:DUF6862 domain-containing protein n=1 Tax=Conservatibacter flavescens TaxID=28161 RepID=UPI001055EC62|nr:hypothetical protein [Conservatibacter flavescens]
MSSDTAKSAVENNYLFANEAKEKFDLLHKENRTEAEENRLQELNELDKQRDQALLSACSGNLLSSGCLSSISDANRAMASYNQNIGNSYIHTFKGLLGNDYKNVEAVLTGKTQDHIEFEKTARIIAQNWDIDVETARDIATYINRGHSVAAAVGGIYSGKTLGNFATKVPDEIDANKKLPVVGETNGYENQVSTLSLDARNIALYSKLKEQLTHENLSNIVKNNSILEHAAFGKGNLTQSGALSTDKIERLAKEWVGDNAIKNSDGGFISADGTRRYRPPHIKHNSPYATTGIQANFERGYKNSNGIFIPESNLHINVKDDK